MAEVMVSREDAAAGSPKPGDMIARNPANHADQWLVSAEYFAANFAAIPDPGGWVLVDERPIVLGLEHAPIWEVLGSVLSAEAPSPGIPQLAWWRYADDPPTLKRDWNEISDLVVTVSRSSATRAARRSRRLRGIRMEFDRSLGQVLEEAHAQKARVATVTLQTFVLVQNAGPDA